MRLPLLSNRDPRAEYSPVWSLQNLKFSTEKNNSFTFFAGIKNLLNWTPAKHNPFLIARRMTLSTAKSAMTPVETYRLPQQTHTVFLLILPICMPQTMEDDFLSVLIIP